MLPLNRPRVVWQVISHKFMRPLVPLAMIGALVSNVWLALHPPRGRQNRWGALAPPVGAFLLGGQGLFYGLAWLGHRAEGREEAAKILYLPAFLVNSNLAALAGLFRHLSRQQSTRWERVRRRG